MAYLPTDEQREVIESPDSALILAGPGRGKTATALAAAERWLATRPRGNVLFTSFSNAAVRRLSHAAGLAGAALSKRVQFRTFHSISLEVLRDYGRFVGIRAPARALDRMEERLLVAQRGWDVEREGDQAAFETHARETGEIPFALMVPWATRLLTDSATLRLAVSSRYPLIVVDEFQDTKPEQWELIRVLGRSSQVLALGDEHQMIYGKQFQATLDRFTEFENWKGTKRRRLVGPNFRCAERAILDIGECILHGERFVGASDRVALFPIYRRQLRVQLTMLWSTIRKEFQGDETIAFLVPSAGAGERIAAELHAPDSGAVMPIPIRAKMEGSEDRADAFRLATCAAIDHVSAQSEESMMRLAFALETLVALGSRKKSLTAASIANRLASRSRAKSPLRDFLEGAATLPTREFAPALLNALAADAQFATAGKAVQRQGCPEVAAVTAVQGRLFDGYLASRPPRVDGWTPSRAKTNIVSMHRCKGREFDFVVMVVDPFAHAKDADLGELRRLHYVAATRAKQWLGIVYPSNDPGVVLSPVLGR